MKKFSIVAVFALLLGAVAVAALPTSSVSAQDKKDAKSQSDTKAKTYQYVAQTGDAYTQIARKAVQTYGLNNKVKLGLAQIVFAETQLTAEAGFPALNEGQTVTFSQDSLKVVVEKAQKLTADEQAAWQYYVPSIDFNTNHIGE